MTVSDISRIERKIRIRAPRQRVWKALTTVGEFSKWFGVRTAGVFEPGARVEMMSTIEGYQGIEFDVVIERMEPPHTFSWRWHPGAIDPGVDYAQEPTTLVVFELTEVEGDTALTVVETGFDRLSIERRARVFAENDKGWQYQLASIGKYLDASAQL